MTFTTDIKLFKQSDGSYDIELDENGALIADNGYSNALLITFGTDARALSNQVVNSENRRGWWGNEFNKNKFDDIGSQLWILKTRPINLSNLNEGKSLLVKAYNWLIEQGRASRVKVDGNFIMDNNGLANGYKFDISILNGNDIIESKTFELWENTNDN